MTSYIYDGIYLEGFLAQENSVGILFSIVIHTGLTKIRSSKFDSLNTQTTNQLYYNHLTSFGLGTYDSIQFKLLQL